MTGDEIAYKSAQELTGLYGTGRLSPVEAAQALFARLDDLQPKLNAFCVVDREGALAAASAPLRSTTQNALSFGSNASSRANSASATSTGESLPLL